MKPELITIDLFNEQPDFVTDDIRKISKENMETAAKQIKEYPKYKEFIKQLHGSIPAIYTRDTHTS